MNLTHVVNSLTPYVPAIVALITSLPVLIGTITKRRSQAPKTQAEAISMLVRTMQTMYEPLNTRVSAAEAECARARQIDRVQHEIINIKTDYASYLLTGVKVLAGQLRRADITPAFLINGEMADYRARLDGAYARLRDLEGQTRRSASSQSHSGARLRQDWPQC